MHCIPHRRSLPPDGPVKHLNIEYFFRWLHRAMVILQCILFGIELGFCLYRSTNTFGDGLFSGTYSTTKSIGRLIGCDILETPDIGPFNNVPVTISSETQSWFIAQMGYYVRLALVLQISMIVLSIVNAVLVDYRVYQLRMHELVIRKIILSMLLLLVIALTLYAAIMANIVAQPVKRYFDNCGVGGNGLQTYLPLSYTYASCGVTLAVLACSVLVNLWHLLVDGPLLTQVEGHHPTAPAPPTAPLGGSFGSFNVDRPAALSPASHHAAGESFDGAAPAGPYPMYEAGGEQQGDAFEEEPRDDFASASAAPAIEERPRYRRRHRHRPPPPAE